MISCFLIAAQLALLADSPAEQLAKSKIKWAEANAKHGNNYSYTVSFRSFVGFGHSTTVFIENGKVVKRQFEAWDSPKAPQLPGAAPTANKTWVEKGDQIGKNPEGANAKTLDELYEAAEKVVNTKLENHQKLYLQMDKDGLLRHAFIVDTRIADDAPRNGIAIDQIKFEK
jgi:hypothetical protein